MKSEEAQTIVKCINTEVLAKSGYKPNLELEKTYPLLESIKCSCGQTHYDVGLKTKLNFITCYKCGEELPIRSDIHWCNSIRFE